MGEESIFRVMRENYVNRVGDEPRVLKTETHSPTKILATDKRDYIMTTGNGYLGYIKFQRGAAEECGCNGCHMEDLLAIVMDQLQGFQGGDCACEENSRALRATEQALGWLRYRTVDRTTRGIRGTGKV